MSTHHLTSVLLLLVTSSVAAATSTEPAGARHSWTSESGAFKGVVKSTRPASVDDTDSDPKISWSVGTKRNLACTLYSESVEPAQFLLDLNAGILSQRPSVTKRSTRGVSAGQLHGYPYLALQTDYQADAAGTLKSYLIEIPFGAVACTHDEAGHDTEVLRHLDFFMKHIEVPTNADLRRTHRVFLIEVNAQPVGFEQQTVRRAPEGKLIDTRRASLLIPHGPGAYLPVDKETVETLAFNGALLKQKTTMKSAGQEQSFEVETSNHEDFSGTGVVNGKNLTVQFKVPSHSLMGTRTASHALGQTLKQRGGRSPITFTVYNPYLNQQGPTQHVSKLTSKLPTGGFMLDETLGKQSQKTTRTNKGHILTITSALGPFTMETTRVYSKDYPRKGR